MTVATSQLAYRLYMEVNYDPSSSSPNHREAVSRAADSFAEEMYEYEIDDPEEIWDRAGGIGSARVRIDEQVIQKWESAGGDVGCNEAEDGAYVFPMRLDRPLRWPGDFYAGVVWDDGKAFAEYRIPSDYPSPF